MSLYPRKPKYFGDNQHIYVKQCMKSKDKNNPLFKFWVDALKYEFPNDSKLANAKDLKTQNNYVAQCMKTIEKPRLSYEEYNLSAPKLISSTK